MAYLDVKKAKRRNQNRIAAQNSREKKKKYLQDLQRKLKLYMEQNGVLLDRVKHLEDENKSLRSGNTNTTTVPLQQPHIHTNTITGTMFSQPQPDTLQREPAPTDLPSLEPPKVKAERGVNNSIMTNVIEPLATSDESAVGRGKEQYVHNYGAIHPSFPLSSSCVPSCEFMGHGQPEYPFNGAGEQYLPNQYTAEVGSEKVEPVVVVKPSKVKQLKRGDSGTIEFIDNSCEEDMFFGAFETSPSDMPFPSDFFSTGYIPALPEVLVGGSIRIADKTWLESEGGFYF